MYKLNEFCVKNTLYIEGEVRTGCPSHIRATQCLQVKRRHLNFTPKTFSLFIFSLSFEFDFSIFFGEFFQFRLLPICSFERIRGQPEVSLQFIWRGRDQSPEWILVFHSITLKLPVGGRNIRFEADEQTSKGRSIFQNEDLSSFAIDLS